MATLGELAVNLTADTTNINQGLNKTFDKLKKFAKIAVAVFAGGAVVSSINRFAESTAKATDRIDKMSQKLGLSRKAFQEWEFILSQSGVSIDRAGVGLRTLASQAVQAERGSMRAVEAFRQLGVETKDANGQFKERNILFTEVVKGLQKMDDEIRRTALAADLFGMFGRELTPIMNATSESIDTLRSDAHDLGLVMSDDVVDAGVRMTDILDRLNRVMDTGKVVLGSIFLPLLESILPIARRISGVMINLTDKINSFFNALRGQSSQQTTQAKATDTLVESNEQLADSFKEAGKEASGSLASFDEVNVLQQEMADTMTGIGMQEIQAPMLEDIKTPTADISTESFSKVAEDIRALIPIWNEIKTLAIDLGAEIKNLWGEFDKFIKDATGKDIYTNVIEALKSIGTASAGALESASGLLKILKGIATVDIETVGTGWNKTMKGLDSIFTSIGEVGGKATLLTFQGLKKTFSWIGTVGGRMVLSVFDAIERQFKTIGTVGGAMAIGIYKSIKFVVDNIGSWLGGIGNQITSWWDGFTSGVGTTIFNIGEWIQSKWTESTTWVSEKASLIWDALKDTWNSFVSTASYPLMNIMDWIQLKWNEGFLGQWISGKWDAFVGTLKGLWESFKSTFSASSGNSIFNISNWIKWLWESGNPIQYITNGWDALVNKLKQLWDAFKQTSIFDFAKWIAGKVVGIPNAIKNAFGKMFGTGTTDASQFWGLSPSTIGAPVQRFATGGLVTSPQLGVLGDNPSGQEAVIPLDNQSALDKIGNAIGNAMMMNQQMQGAGAGAEVVINVDGRQMARAMIPNLEKEQLRRGSTTTIISD